VLHQVNFQLLKHSIKSPQCRAAVPTFSGLRGPYSAELPEHVEHKRRGRGQGARGGGTSRGPKFRENIFSGKCHENSGILLIFTPRALRS